jgi:hypothetical protein
MEESNKIKYKGIDHESLIDIKVSGAYFHRVQDFLFYWMNQKPSEEVAKIIENLKTNQPTDEYSYHLLTIIMLVQEIEKQANEQNLIKDFEIEKNSFNEN